MTLQGLLLHPSQLRKTTDTPFLDKVWREDSNIYQSTPTPTEKCSGPETLTDRVRGVKGEKYSCGLVWRNLGWDHWSRIGLMETFPAEVYVSVSLRDP